MTADKKEGKAPAPAQRAAAPAPCNSESDYTPGADRPPKQWSRGLNCNPDEPTVGGTYWLHGEIVRPSTFGDDSQIVERGIFYDARLDALVWMNPETAGPSAADLARLKLQLNRKLFGRSHATIGDNVFALADLFEDVPAGLLDRTLFGDVAALDLSLRVHQLAAIEPAALAQDQLIQAARRRFIVKDDEVPR